MNNRSKIKNLFINFVLVISMLASILGGVILINSSDKKTAKAIETEMPSDIKFVHQPTPIEINDYNSEDGFEYKNGHSNYIQIKDLIYYVNGGKLYSDSNGKMESSDLTYDPPTTSTVNVGIIGSGKKIVNIYTDRSAIIYNGIRYFLKDGKLYSDINCSIESGFLYSKTGTELLMYSDANPYTEPINDYVEINGNTYYVYDNDLYSKQYFKPSNNSELKTSISSTNTSVWFEVGTSVIDGEYYEVIINGTHYYAKTTWDKRLYTKTGSYEVATPSEFTFREDLDVISGKNYVVATFQHSATGVVDTSFKYKDGLTYYVIDGGIYLCNITAADIIASNSGIYEFDNVYKTIEVNTSEVRPTIVNFIPYYPVEIFGETYYVLKTGSNRLYSLTKNSDGTLSAQQCSPASFYNFTSATVSTSNNLINVKIQYTDKYKFDDYRLYQLYPIKLENKNNFIAYSDTYYYYNNKVYRDKDTVNEVKDFNYVCDIDKVLVNNAYYELQSAEFKYVVIDGTTYYVKEKGKEIELYTHMFLGEGNLIKFTNDDDKPDLFKVITNPFRYKTTESGGKYSLAVFSDEKKSITDNVVNDGGTPSNFSDDTLISSKVDINEIEYDIDPTSKTLTYTANKGETDELTVDYYKINTNYTVNLESTGSGKPISVEIYGQTYSGSDIKQATSGAPPYAYSIYVHTGSDVLFYYNGKLYLTKENGVNTNYLDLTRCIELEEGLVEITNGELTINNTAVSDYIVVNNDNDPSNIIDTVYYADSQTIIKDAHNNYVYNHIYDDNKDPIEFIIDPSTDKLKRTSDLQDVEKVFFNYTYDFTTGKVTLTERYNHITGSYEELSPTFLNIEDINYIEDDTDTKIVFSSNNSLNLYDKITLDSNHNYNSASKITSAEFKARSLHINTHPTNSYYDIQNFSGKNYKADIYSNLDKNVKDGDHVILDNYFAKAYNGSKANAFYVGLHEKPTENSTVNSGIHNLSVQVYLDNDYVMKYFETSAGYDENYGIMLDVNEPESVDVSYSAYSGINTTSYWYDYFDLTDVWARVRYESIEDGNPTTKYITERIEETSGRYTFIFDFHYINGNKSQAYRCIYSVYISESSDYIEFPTFNTAITTNISDEYPISGYSNIVSNIKKADDTSSTEKYSYNGATYDIPIYSFDASKYNVEYSLTYNIDKYNYSTKFRTENTGITGHEYGVYEVYLESSLIDTYTLHPKTVGGNNIVEYYKNSEYYGALCITSDGDFLLSLENYSHYNKFNKSKYDNEIDYYLAGSLIKNGAKNTPLSYYMVLVFDELGVYEIKNHYLMPVGSSNGGRTGNFAILSQQTKDVLYGEYTEYNFGSRNIRNGEILKYGRYNSNGEFVFNNTGIDLPSSDPANGDNFGLIDSTTLTYYGIKTKFIKDGDELQFKKLDEAIYSDITPNTLLATIFEDIDSISFQDKTLSFGKAQNAAVTGGWETTSKVPITNLQPIYFDYYGSFNYRNSFYYRFENVNYVLDSNNNLSSVEFTRSVKKSKINFTNKTTISAPGFYIVKVDYGIDSSVDDDDKLTQYFAFAIDNSAPNLEIYKIFDDGTEEVFVSSTEFSSTSRYTNVKYVRAKWPTPNYFQGDVTLEYKRTSYDGQSVLTSVDNYNNGSIIATANGRYTFTIKYGVGGLSYTSTYIIIDHDSPTGEMYSVKKPIGSSEYFISNDTPTANVFNSYSTFAASPMDSTSGAKVYAKINIVSMSSFNNDGAENKVITNPDNTYIEAIKTNVSIKSDNELFDSGIFESSPKYSFFDRSLVEKDVKVLPSQVLGNSDQSLIYIIYLYDEAGNSTIYYYLFDKSLPYVVFQVKESIDSDNLNNLVDTLENNTTETNTNVYWGDYKAIQIENTPEEDSLYTEFRKSVTEAYDLRKNTYGGIFFKDIKDASGNTTATYLYIPIEKTEIVRPVSIEGVSEDITATTTSSGVFAKKFTLFVEKTKSAEELERLNNYIQTSNSPDSFKLKINSDNSIIDGTSKYYYDFFKGDKTYHFYVTDKFGNTHINQITMNTSVAQETFFLNDTSGLNTEKAYNADNLTLTYRNLITHFGQQFSAQITYDYFDIDFEKFLVEYQYDGDTITNKDDSIQYYYGYGYDTSNGKVYKYEATDADSIYFVECTYDPTHEDADEKGYVKKTKTVTNPDTGQPTKVTDTITYEELPDSVFFPGFPYLNTKNNVLVNTSQHPIEQKLLGSNTIYDEAGKTKAGLYVFRRSYIDLDGNEISQAAIDDENSEYQILQNDYAIRFYVYYIDRNNIIELSYDNFGNLDSITSIGDLIEIYLGKDINGEKEPLITAEMMKNDNSLTALETNKLKIETNFPTEKYATIEKLEAHRRYTYNGNTEGTSFNELMEDISRKRNATLFKYNFSLNIKATTEEPIITNNVIKEITKVSEVKTNIVSASGNKEKVNYATNESGEYKLVLTDSSSILATGNAVVKAANTEDFSFNVMHKSPAGTFTTKEDDDYGSVRALSIRDGGEIINTEGSIKTFTSSNVNNLSFRFSDSSNEFDATINPYQVVVTKTDLDGKDTVLFSTKYTPASQDDGYINTFGTLVIANNASLNDVFTIEGAEAPYTYTINIFNKNSNKNLLSNWEEDATYTVKINYIGDNKEDYTSNDKNYFVSYCKIHIDRKAPENNLQNLVNNDPNLNNYAMSLYGKTYSELKISTNPVDVENYQKLLKSYALPIRLIEEDNLLYYYKKGHPGSTKERLSAEDKDWVYETYSTLFNFDYDDSVNVFVRNIGDDPTTYRYSILPSEKEYTEGINGHIKFTEASKEFTKLSYDGYLNFSTKTDDFGNLCFPENGYYEIIEIDEAGNLTRYFAYIADNTNIELEINYINFKDDKTESLDDCLEHYILHNDVRYYIKADVDNEFYTKRIDEDGEIKVEPYVGFTNVQITPYIYSHDNGDYYAVPYIASFTDNNVDYTYNVQKDENGETLNNQNTIMGGLLLTQDSSKSNIIHMLNLTGLHIINPQEKDGDGNFINRLYTFDDFITVNVYTVASNVETLILSRTSNPYNSNIGSGHKFLNDCVSKISEITSTNSSVYSYKIEILDRYSKSPFVFYANLPDTELNLTFITNDKGNLEVTIPDYSTYNVKITNFSVFYYQDKEWHPLTQDINKQIIQSIASNEEGLKATTYEFAPGQYRFYYKDNHDRSETKYMIVGEDVDNEFEFVFTKPRIERDETKYITSGETILMIDDNIYQIKVGLKDAVQVKYSTDGSTFYAYYDLITIGNSTILCKFDGNTYNRIYYHSHGSDINEILNIEEVGDGGVGTEIYYFMGRLYTNEECTSILISEDFEFTVRVQTSGRMIYTFGNSIGFRKSYIMKPFENFDTQPTNICEYVVLINWLAAPEDIRAYNVTIDKTSPTLTLMTESGLLEAINNQNYNKEFTISWSSNYKIVSARIIKYVNSIRGELILDPNGTYDVHEIGSYNLYLTDEIGNELYVRGSLGFEFNFVENENEYFSVLINEINTLPSDYPSTYEYDGVTTSLRTYYYKGLTAGTDVIEIKTDETKNIKAQKIEENIYAIKRTNINHTICYVQIVRIEPTENISDFLKGIQFNLADTSKTAVTYDKAKSTYMLDQSYDSFTLTVYKNLYSSTPTNYKAYIGDKVNVEHYYNDNYVRTYRSDSWSTLTGKNNAPLTNDVFDIKISATGVHKFVFYDDVNNKALNDIEITLIKDIMFSANNENPIDYRIYNDNVEIDIPENPQYYNEPTVTATLNGTTIDTAVLKVGTKYTFKDPGIYVVTMSALDKNGVEYESVYNFTIINPSVARMTFGFSNSYGFTISKVLKNNADITSNITSENYDSMWLTSGKDNSIGTYTITLLGYDKITNDYMPFTFVVKLNNETPSISAVGFEFGTKTKKNITLQYNPALIYSQIGDSYIHIVNIDEGIEERIDITAESLDMLTNIVISQNGKYNVTIYNNEGKFITNYTFTKVAPLNASAKLIIIIVSVVIVALTITFIILRRHTKFR